MSPLLVPILALLIPIVAIAAGAYQKVAQFKAETARELGRATGHLDEELKEATAERDALRRRVEVLEAIVTSDGFDLEREARRAGLAEGRIDSGLLDAEPPDLTATPGERRRVR